MPISKKLIDELHKKSGLPVADCRESLKAHGGDVDAALAALIDAGKVKANQLDPDLVSDAVFERAAKKERLDTYRQLTDPTGGVFAQFAKMAGKTLGKDFAKAFGQIQKEVLGNMSAEELMAEHDKRRAENLKRLEKKMGKKIKPPSAGEHARMMAQVERRRQYLKKHPYTLKLPPFPPLKREMHEWTGHDVLKSWAGSQQRQGGYTSLSSDKPSKGSFRIDIPCIGEDDANPAPPSKEQIAAYAYLKKNQRAITEKIMAALLVDYTDLRKRWLKSNSAFEDELPEIKSITTMKKNIGLGTLHMFGIAKGGFAYIGLEFGCTWDEEHGAGVIVHRDRVVDIGQADTSFNEHSAIKDGGKKIS